MIKKNAATVVASVIFIFFYIISGLRPLIRLRLLIAVFARDSISSASGRFQVKFVNAPEALTNLNFVTNILDLIVIEGPRSLLTVRVFPR